MLNKNFLFSFLLFFLLVVVSFFSIFIGVANINLKDIFNVDSNTYLIIFKLRLPRIILGIIAGGVLSVSGVVFQTILKNDLAEPYLLGISSGAAFGASLSVFLSTFVFGFRLPFFPFALAGSLFSVFIIFVFASKVNYGLFNIIFIGLSVSFLYNAGVTLIFSILGNKANEIIQWLFGSLSKPVSYNVLFSLFVSYIFFLLILLFLSKILDIIYLPEETVITTGVNIKFFRILFFVITSIMTGLIVSYCGVIAFIGLVIPHISRLIFGTKHRILLISSALLGGLILIISDNIARTIVPAISKYGMELPIGVVTSLIGSPFFIYLIGKKR